MSEACAPEAGVGPGLAVRGPVSWGSVLQDTGGPTKLTPLEGLTPATAPSWRNPLVRPQGDRSRAPGDFCGNQVSVLLPAIL